MTEYAMTTDSDERKEIPLAEGVLYYFGPALVEMAKLSKVGNDKHNPDQPLHWSREKSNDHADCIMRHLLDAGTDDTDGVPHSVKVAWRACALATEDLIARKGYKAPKNARTTEKPKTGGGVGAVEDIAQRLRASLNAADAARLSVEIDLAAGLVATGRTTFADARRYLRSSASRTSHRVG